MQQRAGGQAGLTQEPRDLVDGTEGERLTGLTKATLYRLAREGRIRSFKVLGYAVRFDRADLQRLVVERPATCGTPETQTP